MPTDLWGGAVVTRVTRWKYYNDFMVMSAACVLITNPTCKIKLMKMKGDELKEIVIDRHYVIGFLDGRKLIKGVQ